MSMTIGELLDRAVEKFGDRLAYVFPGVERVTYRELSERVDRCARGLLALGIQRGERVSVWMPNNPEWVYLYLAIARIGATVVPINTGFRVEEAAYVVGQSESTMLVVSAGFKYRDLVADARAVLADEHVSARQLVVIGDDSATDAVTMKRLWECAEEVAPEVLQARKLEVDPDDVVVILYTSGTTGFPRGAMHSHKLIRNMVDAADRMRLTYDDKVVLYLPLFHVFAAAAIVTYAYCGGSIVLMEYFDAGWSLELMEEERATIVYGLTPMYYDQLYHPGFAGRDLSSVRLCLVPGTGDLVRLVSEKMGLAVNLYGMTETTSITTLPHPDDPEDLRADTVGRPLPGFEVKIVTPDGEAAGAETPGELVVRGHPVMLGYYKNPEATAAVLDSQGWFRTGDAAQLTAEGYVRYVGRIKDMFKVGGENVDPIEVETVLMRHPAVALAAVFGIPDRRLGEIGVACVQRKAGETVSAEDVIQYVKERLAFYKVPKQVVFVDEFPKTGSGKIQKFRLREAIIAGGDGPSVELAGRAEDAGAKA